MKVLPAVLMLALAALAIPSSSADPVLAPCGIDGDGDLVCHAEARTCSADVVVYDVEDQPNQAGATCSTTQTGVCTVATGQPPAIGCENYGPGDGSRSAGPSGPCISGIAGWQCTVAAGPCSATAGFYTPQSSQYAHGGCSAGGAGCGASAGASLVVTTAVAAAVDCGQGITHCHVGYGVGQMLLPLQEPDVWCAF